MAMNHITTIDQHKGNHQSGGPIMGLVDVRTEFGDYSQDRWDDLSSADRAWWESTLLGIHNARVDLASLDADHRERATEWMLEQGGCDDVEGVAPFTRRAIEATRNA